MLKAMGAHSSYGLTIIRHILTVVKWQWFMQNNNHAYLWNVMLKAMHKYMLVGCHIWEVSYLGNVRLKKL